jgi:hypothetical protein
MIEPEAWRKEPFSLSAYLFATGRRIGRVAGRVGLAERYWTYQDVRRGQKLEVLPVQDSKMQQWVSVARLMQTNWDDKTDASGEIRKAKTELQKARGLSAHAADIQRGVSNFLAGLARSDRGRTATPAEIIELEVAHNHGRHSGIRICTCWRCSACC